MKSIIFALLIVFASSSIVGIEDPISNLNRFIKCIKEAYPYSKETIEIIQLIRQKDYENIIIKIIELLNSGNQLIKRGLNYISGKTINDWSGFFQCPQHIPKSKSIRVFGIIIGICKKKK